MSWTAHATITGIPIPQAWSLVKNRSWFAWFRGQEAQAQMPEIFMPVEGLFPLCSHGMEGQRAENTNSTVLLHGRRKEDRKPPLYITFKKVLNTSRRRLCPHEAITLRVFTFHHYHTGDIVSTHTIKFAEDITQTTAHLHIHVQCVGRDLLKVGLSWNCLTQCSHMTFPWGMAYNAMTLV